MKLTKEELSLENGIKKEWIITNGIGGFASSTVLGANTRKYHGLLIAPMTPPARRHLMLSKVDESIEIYGKSYNLYTNMGKEYISDGYKNLTCFEKKYLPKYTYEIENNKIEKTICMKYRENTVVISYKIKTGNADVKFKLAPIVNFRDFHTVSANKEFLLKQQIKQRKVKIIIDEVNTTPIYLSLSEGEYIEHHNDIFRNMYYPEEEKRGFYPEENHVVCGRYEVYIPHNTTKELTFVCSLEENIEEIDANNVIKEEIKRLDNIIEQTQLNTKKEMIKQLVISADSFVIYRPAFSLHSVIAGYPWFLDWGRDTLISFEGLFLITKRFDLAKEILLTIIRDVKYGLVPNGYSGFDNRPLYNSVDSSLLLFEQVNKYLKYTKDEEFIKEKIYPVLKNVIHSYEEGIDVDDNNIYLDKDGLIVSGTENTQNTWMDAKIGNFVVTPRNGKAVEINSLWYNALKTLEALSKKFEDEETSKYCAKLARKCKKAFNEKFYNPKKKCLYDVLGDSKVRPNQIFALSLTYPVLDLKEEVASQVFNTVTKKLLKKHGLKTLAKGEKDYVDTYEGDSFRRDMSYHQGITWVWLLGPYYDAYKNLINAKKDEQEKEDMRKELIKWKKELEKTFEFEILHNGCLGSIAELYDSRMPYLPKGAYSQAWSVAEILRILVDEK